MNREEEITTWIEKHSTQIINNINQESIDVYNFLKKEFKSTKANNNYLFQFLYRSYYRIDNAGLTPQFKKEYFTILEEIRHEKKIDISAILKRLYSFPNSKGQNTVQFSFATKMLNTIDDTLPIYDSEVARMFSLSRPYQSELEIKISKYIKQYEIIKSVYDQIIGKQMLPKTTTLFDKTFLDNKLSDMKRLDFIFWSAGKIKKSIGKEESNLIQVDGMFEETEGQRVIADYNSALQLRNLRYSVKDICNHMSISEDELTDLEIKFNYITGR